MATSDNILQQVITYQEGMLAFLTNYGCFVNTSNTRFKNFDRITANLGDTVSFDLPPRFTTTNSLVVSFQGAEQRVHNLTVDQAASTAIEFSAQQFIFNVRDYMEKFGRAAVAEIATQVESNIALNAETGPYRFYGNGTTAINSYLQLASALAQFRTFGAVQTQTKGYLLDTAIPDIVNSGLAQFAPNRNNETANSWELSDFSNCMWYQSNLLPLHVAGTEGQQASTLTVVSTTTNADGAVTSITFSGTDAASDADSVKQYDSFQFADGVSGFQNLRFLTFVGHKVSQAPVQFQATADAASTGASQVTVSINPPLQAASGKNQNINTPIVAGMQCTVLPNHRCGLITSGNPLFLAMPSLPNTTPFPSSSKSDPDTGVSLRAYYGEQFGQNARGLVTDVIWGSTLVPEYSMKIAFPE